MGNLVWKKVFSSSKGDEAYSIIEDDGYVIVSATNYGSPNECDLLIFKFSENGEIVWQKSYKGSDRVYATKIIKSIDGNYIVAGYIQNQNFEKRGFISKFNKNGELIWSKVIEIESIIFGVEETKDGVLCTGVLGDWNSRDLSFILEIDLNGNILKEKVFEFSSYNTIYNIAKISDEEFILTGTYSNNMCCDSNMLILKLNLNAENQNFCPYEFDISIAISDYSFEELTSTIAEISKPIEIYDSYWANIEIDSKLELFCNNCPIFTILPKKLPDAKMNNYYVQIISSANGEPPYLYSLLKGKLPFGLNLTKEGLISGIPQEAGKFNFTIKVEDKNGCTTIKPYSIEVKINETPTWLETISGTEYYSKNFLEINDIGNLVFIGQSKLDLLFLLFDEYGNLMQKKIYEKETEGNINSVIKTSDSSYMLLLEYFTEESFGLIKLDKNGKILWRKGYQFPPNIENFYPKSIVETNDGDFIISGAFKKNNRENMSILIIKISKSGEVLWSNIYKNGYYNYLQNVIKTSDGNFLIASMSTQGFENYKLSIFKIDAFGNIIWEKLYKLNEYFHFYDLEESSENSIYLIGDIETEEFQYSLLILKLNKNGELIWQNVYTSMDSATGIKIFEERHNSLIAIGNNFQVWYDPCGHGYLSKGAFILNIDYDGEIIKQRDIDFYYDNFITDCTKTNDGFVFSGKAINTNSKSVSWILKLDQTLNIDEPCYVKSKISFSKREKTPYLFSQELSIENIYLFEKIISLNSYEKEIEIETLCPNNYNFDFNYYPIEKFQL